MGTKKIPIRRFSYKLNVRHTHAHIRSYTNTHTHNTNTYTHIHTHPSIYCWIISLRKTNKNNKIKDEDKSMRYANKGHSSSPLDGF